MKKHNSNLSFSKENLKLLSVGEGDRNERFAILGTEQKDDSLIVKISGTIAVSIVSWEASEAELEIRADPIFLQSLAEALIEVNQQRGKNEK